MEFKIATILYNYFGWGIPVSAIIVNFGDIKSWVLFALGAVYMTQKIVQLGQTMYDKYLESSKKKSSLIIIGIRTGEVRNQRIPL